ncbi:hypothetical protein [Cryptosporangium phraense]|uniref:Uncharacterized protein n=1 Tax=Cryptosporangium phraense TaxID=2593070 RepID=A0A545AGA8_9ACTN|nr:hypothetical protein [Cryptosporangium phraense]TQS40368.1 hypothetical protein FL583_35135 [Cryptosporangium phraense]
MSRHGVPRLRTALSWSATVGRQERGRPGLGSGPRVRHAPEGLPRQAADVRVAGAPVPFWRNFVARGPACGGYPGWLVVGPWIHGESGELRASEATSDG